MLAFFSCLIAGAGAVALVTAGILLWKVWKTDQGVQMAESDASVEMTGTSDAESTCAQAAEAGTEENLGQVQLSDDSPLKKIVTSGKAVSEALKERPESVTLTQDNAAEFASIKTCEINAGTGKVEITVESPGIAVSDDKYYYLFNESTFAEGINDGQEAVVSSYKDSEVTFSVNLNRGESDSRLYDKFVVAVRKDGAYLPVSHARYITNPEAIASCSYAGMKQDSIKGLLIDPTKVAGSELDDLGVNYATYNIPLARILGGTSNGAYPTITYSYDGVTYHS